MGDPISDAYWTANASDVAVTNSITGTLAPLIKTTIANHLAHNEVSRAPIASRAGGLDEGKHAAAVAAFQAYLNTWAESQRAPSALADRFVVSIWVPR